MPSSRPSRGAVLLEVLAAIVVFALAALALTELVAGSVRALGEIRAREHVLADQERLLTAYTLLTKSELDQRLGSRTVGPYLVAIQRPEPALYRIAVSRSETPELEDLVTVVYRAGGADVP